MADTEPLQLDVTKIRVVTSWGDVARGIPSLILPPEIQLITWQMDTDVLRGAGCSERGCLTSPGLLCCCPLPALHLWFHMNAQAEMPSSRMWVWIHWPLWQCSRTFLLTDLLPQQLGTAQSAQLGSQLQPLDTEYSLSGHSHKMQPVLVGTGSRFGHTTEWDRFNPQWVGKGEDSLLLSIHKPFWLEITGKTWAVTCSQCFSIPLHLAAAPPAEQVGVASLERAGRCLSLFCIL